MILFRGQPLPARYRAARGRRGLTPILPDAYISPATGRMAEWLCNGLQIRVQRFDSASGLQPSVLRSRHPRSPELSAGWDAAGSSAGQPYNDCSRIKRTIEPLVNV